MPFRPEHSLLRVDVPALHTIDTSSAENLFGMWSIFAKTSHAMEDGRRLENLSWRVWNRETFCCAPDRKTRSTRRHRTSTNASTTVPVTPATDTLQPPELSHDVDSDSSSDSDLDPSQSHHVSSTSPSLSARPELRRLDSSGSATCRGREKHITSMDLQNFVQSIKETPDVKPIDIVLRSSPQKEEARRDSNPETSQDLSLSDTVESTTASTLLESSVSSNTNATSVANDMKASVSQSFGSDDTSTTEVSTHSIVRGFHPGGAPSSYRSQTNLAAQPTPILKKSAPLQTAHKKRGPVFTIGTSSGEEESSLDSHMYKSSLSESLRRSPAKMGSNDGGARKQTSFRTELTIARHSPVFESDDEDDEAISESAIEDDDDSSDWEDSDDQSGSSSIREKELFQRVDSRPNLTSRRSLLTTLMHEPDRARALAQAATRSSPALRRSRTTTPNGPSIATSPEQGAPLHAGAHMSQTSSHVDMSARAKPIAMNQSNMYGQQQLALSPRTTRRNMLATELTESLRKNLLWERQHRSTGNLAALKRRHTSHDVKNLRQHPEPAPVLVQGNRGFTNDYFHAGLQEFHNNGW